MDRASIEAQRARMSASAAFAHGGRIYALLKYLVDATLDGSADRLNQHAIAVDVFGRGRDFDAATDAIVRVECGRLREKLREYYATDGTADRIIVEVPKGGYTARMCFVEGRAYDHTQLPKQEIRYCRTPDGVSLAYSTVGSGYPLVMLPHWLSHLEADFRNPLRSHYWVELSRRFTLIRYDSRSFGLSDRDVADYPFDALLTDLDTVLNAIGVERCALLGQSGGAPVGVAYAARRPDRVSHLALLGSFIRGPRRTGDPQAIAFADAVDALIRLGWGQPSSRFRNVFCSILVPDGTPDQYKLMDEAQLAASTGENAERFFKLLSDVDVTDDAARVTAPTLVFHGTGETGVPFAEAQYITARIPNAQLVPLPTKNHLLLADESAWPHFLQALDAFIGAADRESFMQSRPSPGRTRSAGMRRIERR